MTTNENDLQVHLEAFQANLHGSRILLQGPYSPGKYPPVLEAIQNIREPFKRRILLTSHTDLIANTIKLSYEAVFRIQTTTDWSLVLNYIQHLISQPIGTPLLVVIEDLEIPDGFFAKLPATVTSNKITMVNFTSKPIKIHPDLASLYDTIFFPVQQDIGAQGAHHIFTALQVIYRPGWSFQEFREILTEVRAAGAGLCWTRVGGKNGNIFWYDPVHSLRTNELNREKAAYLLRWIAEELN
jgi:hypothetical protein